MNPKHLLIIATLVTPTYSFIPLHVKTRSDPRRNDVVWSHEVDFYESEEAAAYDAHDAIDPGIEAAAMERSVMMADQMKHTMKRKISKKPKMEAELQIPLEEFENTDIYEAEEAAAYDAHDAIDAGFESAAMERAVMMAYRMMADKRKNIKTQLDHMKSTEDEMVILERATEDLGKRYRENPSEFQATFSESDTNRLAIEMIEKAISNAAEKIFEAEVSYDLVNKEKLRSTEKRNMAEAMAKQFQTEMKISEKSSLMSEDFADEKDVEERRRDAATVHALKHLVHDTNDMSQDALDRESMSLGRMEWIKNRINRLQENQQSLKADLEELSKMVNEKLKEEWDLERTAAEHQ